MTSTQEIYKPPGCLTLDKLTDIPQIRLGIQGFGGTGKTHASLTFPNPIIGNMDRGVGAHIGRSDVIEVPFYSSSFCRSIYPNFTPENLKDVILKWLQTEGMKLKPHQTYIHDGNTTTQNAYHLWYQQNKGSFLTREGKINEFSEWSEKKNYYAELLETLKALPCHVVYICHEVDKKEKNGSYAGKVRPLLTGQVGDELMTHFTDFFRQLCCEKPTDFNALTADKLKLWGMTSPKEFKEMCDGFKCDTLYYWQTQGDDIFDGKCSSMVGQPRFIPADYSSFEKFRRKPVQTKV